MVAIGLQKVIILKEKIPQVLVQPEGGCGPSACM